MGNAKRSVENPGEEIQGHAKGIQRDPEKI
jgi:hypothetical protein